MSRRGALGVGLGVVSVLGLSHLVGVDDDALRAIGASPHPEPDPADAARLRRAVRDQQALVARLQVVVEQTPEVPAAYPGLLEAAEAQLAQLGGEPPANLDLTSVDTVDTARAFAASARRREADALTTSDVALARVLASLSAGQAQIARAIGRAT